MPLDQLITNIDHNKKPPTPLGAALQRICIWKRADIARIQNDLALELVRMFFDLVVSDHNDHQVNIRKESVKVVILVLYNVTGHKGIIGLQRLGKVETPGNRPRFPYTSDRKDRHGKDPSCRARA